MFNITVIRPTGFLHSSGFTEVVDSLAWALSSLGEVVSITENTLTENGINIIFGAELLQAGQTLPSKTIIYNLEQPTHPHMALVRELAKGHQVWDYSASNCETWKKLGHDVRHVPIGYTPILSKIPKTEEQDIDVLFYGWLTPRRMEIFEQLKGSELNVRFASDCYGGARDNLISRSRVVLNLHHDGRNLFEIVRVSYLLANGKTVITEPSADDGEYLDLKDALIFVNHNDIVKYCRAFNVHKIDKNAVRFDIDGFGERARKIVQQRDYVAYVKKALSPENKVHSRYCDAVTHDNEKFLPWLRDHAKGNVLEIGVRQGSSTSALLDGLSKNGGHLYSVDIKDCGHLFTGHPLWTFRQEDSKTTEFPGVMFDLVFIDGDHSAEGYRADLNKWFPFVKFGGLIASHDIVTKTGMTYEDNAPAYPSRYIRDIYFEFCSTHKLEHYEFEEWPGLGVMVKAE